MDEPQSLVNLLMGDGRTIGTTLKSASPNITEALGYTPLDFLFIDRQHESPIDTTLEEMVRTADLGKLPVMVRVPKGATGMITYLLDFGVRGIVLPQIDGPEAVREASHYVRYKDGRSLAMSTRAARFGETDRERYKEYVNEDLALCPMIETIDALEQIGDITALAETTGVMIGPADLSASLGTTMNSETTKRAIDRIFDTAASHDCPVGVFIGPDDLDRYADRASFTVLSNDIDVLMRYYREMLGE